MANDKSCKQNEASEGTAQADAQRRIIWDDSHIRSLYANVARVMGTREEIVLLFGESHAGYADSKEVWLQIKERIILAPIAAKHFAILLNNSIQEYESKFGFLEMGSLPLTELDQRPSFQPLLSKVGNMDEKARLPLQLVGNLNVQYGFERSFKVFEKTFLANRFLLGFKKDDVRENSHEKIREICVRMNMPESLLKAFEEYIPDADYIHLGFEENEKTCIYKVYLEFYEKIKKEMKSPGSASDRFLMHLGFKWDVSDNTKQTLTDYTWYPSLSVENTLRKLSGILYSNQHRNTLELAKGILDMASQRIPHHDILYLEVTEKDNPRKSFDINIYNARLQLSELYPFLVDMCRNYSITRKQFHDSYDQIKTRVCGHLSGGVDREGRDFFTVYYGVKGVMKHGAQAEPFRVEAPLTAEATRKSISRKKPSFAGIEETDEKAGMLFELVNRLNVKVGFERSFKVLRNTLLPDRFLVGFKRKNIAPTSHNRIVNICQQMGIPEGFMETFQEHLPESNIVLFGFEKNEKNSVYKSYLEFGHRILDAIKKNPENPEPLIIHMGFKWDVSDNTRCAMAHYTCFPSFSVKNMLKRLSNVFYSHNHRHPFKIAEGIVNLALSRADPDEFLYFEAQEENNPRRSFDINMYRANLRLTELYPLLLKMCRHYAIPLEEFHYRYDPVKTQIFGHLSGGVDREGRDFLTVYFGEKGSTRR